MKTKLSISPVLAAALLIAIQLACSTTPTPPAALPPTSTLVPTEPVPTGTPTLTPFPTSLPAFLTIQAVSEPGIRFDATVDGLYRFTIDSGALQNCPPGADPSNPNCNTWTTDLLVYKNRPAQWTRNPANWDYEFGVNTPSASAAEAESLGAGTYTDIPLLKGDYLIIIVNDCTTCYHDNSGELKLRVNIIGP